MSQLLAPSQVQESFLAACRAELRALKAGNVHVHAPGHGMEVEQFESAAVAAAPIVADTKLRPGQRILQSVEASFAAAGCNTNLGILLLCVPLAVAAQDRSPERDLRRRLAHVLDRLDQQDAADAYSAIALAKPGGLGSANEQDVKAPPSVTLKQAMALAADRDRIANAYVTDFADIFDFALPQLHAARVIERDEEDAIASLHLRLLAEFPDSHIARKYGLAEAERISAMAADLHPKVFPLSSSGARTRLLEFDADLKKHKVNPGTTADFVVASLFADAIIRRGRHTAAV